MNHFPTFDGVSDANRNYLNVLASDENENIGMEGPLSTLSPPFLIMKNEAYLSERGDEGLTEPNVVCDVHNTSCI